jgi:hypothetical protein
MNLTDQDYQVRFAAYLKEQGPNPSTDVTGSSEWVSLKHSEFREILRREGFEIEGYEKDRAVEDSQVEKGSASAEKPSISFERYNKTYRFI